MSKITNTVLVIGGDHVNTLAVVRDLGRHNCRMEILVHGEFSSVKEINVAKSKYAKGSTFFAEDTEEAIFQWIKNHMKKEKKVVLFPCSDLAAYIMDLHYEELAEYCYLPGFKDKPGLVAELMDKYKQKLFADQHGIKMAETKIIDLLSEDYLNLNNVKIPCILKPRLSALGCKDDIAICHTGQELEEELVRFKEKGYEEALYQEYIKKDYELLLSGCSLDMKTKEVQKVKIGGLLKKLLEWPLEGGSNVYGVFINDQALIEKTYKVVDILKDLSFVGLYDIEFFVCKDDVYLNEINFRHSGMGFALINNGISAPYYYCHSCVDNIAIPSGNKWMEAGKTMMYEIEFIKYRKAYGFSLKEWILLFCRCSAYSMFSRNDLPGSFAFLSARFKNLLRKLRKKI